MPETQTPQVPDPQAGGRYVRESDGSLTQIHKTVEAPAVSLPGEPAAQPNQLAADTGIAKE